MRKLILLIALCLSSLPVMAADEYRFGVIGTFNLTPAGTVADVHYEFAPPEALEAFVESTINTWRFAPVVEDGQPVGIRVRFTFDLIAVPEGDQVVVTLGETDYSEVRALTSIRTHPPSYPESALMNDTEATVVVEFLTGPDGRVTDVHVSSVGLAFEYRLGQSTRTRIVRDFANAARSSIRRWVFSPPPDGESPAGRIRINFVMSQAQASSGNYTWYDMDPAPWRTEGDGPVVRNASSSGEYDLGDARIRRLADVVPAS